VRDILCFSTSTKRKTKITYLEHQKNIVNTSGWNEYIISITNPNDKDIQKTIFLEGTRYNRDDTGCWVRDSDFDSKILATLENMSVRPGDTVQVTVPVQRKSMGERNFYIFNIRLLKWKAWGIPLQSLPE
jgi:hypothetical protein